MNVYQEELKEGHRTKTFPDTQLKWLEGLHKLILTFSGLDMDEIQMKVFNAVPEYGTESATICFAVSLIFWPILFFCTYGLVSRVLGHTEAWKRMNYKERFYYTSNYSGML